MRIFYDWTPAFAGVTCWGDARMTGCYDAGMIQNGHTGVGRYPVILKIDEV
jgi:hypothetical protein